MIIKCPKCGIEYSYGRNICHICKDHSIFFGAIFKGDRNAHPWNCENEMNLATSDNGFIKSKTQLDSDKCELKFEEINSYKWNCDLSFRIE
jgi:hypothetical protein